jgi:pimeloyl-ACP methyl ester carboxylesterase
MKFQRFVLGALGGAALGWLAGQHIWVWRQIGGRDPRLTVAAHRNLGKPGRNLIAEEETRLYLRRHFIEDGIERIAYIPHNKRSQTPILMQHGMWHGAWCWRPWQELLAGWGWESVAVSLPGHGRSPEQKPIRLCTLDYYLGFLKAEIDRFPRPPLVMGHSMGGALIQWYWKYVGDLPAAVLVAPWVFDSVFRDGLLRFIWNDPAIGPLTLLDWSASPWVRNPRRAAGLLISGDALVSPEELHAQIGPETILGPYQHNPPIWRPSPQIGTPTLWLSGEKDMAVSAAGVERSARHYRGDYALVAGAGHNLMMEPSYEETAGIIHNWLYKRFSDKRPTTNDQRPTLVDD